MIASPPLRARATLLWTVLGLVVIPLAGGLAVSSGALAVVAAAWTILVGGASRSGQVLAAVRAIERPPGAPPLRDDAWPKPWRLAPQVALGAGLALPVAALAAGAASWLGALDVPKPLVAASIPLGGAAACALAGAGVAAPRGRPRVTTKTGAVLDGALPTAALAALFGVVLLAARLGAAPLGEGEAPIGLSLTPELFARHLTISTLIYALFLGAASALKSFTEARYGLILVEPPARYIPSPVLLCAGLAGVYWLIPLEPIVEAGPTALLVVKGGVSAAVGLLAGTLGTLRGLRAARR